MLIATLKAVHFLLRVAELGHVDGMPTSLVRRDTRSDMRRSSVAMPRVRPPPWLNPQTPMRLLSISEREFRKSIPLTQSM